jgi:hypothetical protein
MSVLFLFTCFCSTHRFVVKGGEDLRLDERIQQLWRLLSGLAGRHPAAAKRGLATALTTFDVIPLSPTLGLMAFVQVGVDLGCMCRSGWVGHANFGTCAARAACICRCAACL